MDNALFYPTVTNATCSGTSNCALGSQCSSTSMCTTGSCCAYIVNSKADLKSLNDTYPSTLLDSQPRGLLVRS